MDAKETIQKVKELASVSAPVVHASDDACPSFPVEVFPVELQNIIAAYHEYESLNTDFLCGAMLTAFAAAMGNGWKVMFNTTWVSPAIIFMAIIGKPSSGKSPAIDAAIAPFHAVEKVWDAEYAAVRQDYDDRDAQGEKGIKPPFHRNILSDNSTIEVTLSKLNANPHGLLCVADELSQLLGNMSRYNRGSDEPYWLKAFNGSCIKYERKTDNVYYNIASPFMCIIGGTQEGVVSKVFGKSQIENGLAARFLKIIPDIQEKQRWSDKLMPTDVAERWEKILRGVLDAALAYGEGEGVTCQEVTMSDAARHILNTWQEESCNLWKEAEDSYMHGVLGKLDSYVVRLSLVMQIMRWRCDGASDKEIDTVSAQRACVLVKYFLGMEERFLKLVNHCPFDGIQQQIYDLLPDETFTTAQAYAIGQSQGASESTVKRFLVAGQSMGFLHKASYGHYKKA